MSLKKQIDSELVFLKEVIGNDSSNLSEDIQLLRSITMVIHLSIEALLENIIMYYLTEPFRIGKTHQQIIELTTCFAKSNLRVEKLITDMDFVKKVNFLEKVGIITKESKVKGKIMKVNELRVTFSHPLSHRNKLDLLRIDENYLIAIQSLREGYTSIDEYHTEKIFGIKK